MESFTAGSAESSRDENEDPDSLLEEGIAGESILWHFLYQSVRIQFVATHLRTKLLPSLSKS